MTSNDQAVNALALWIQDISVRNAAQDPVAFISFKAGTCKLVLCVATRADAKLEPGIAEPVEAEVLYGLANELEALGGVRVMFSLQSAGVLADEKEVCAALAITLRKTIDRITEWNRAVNLEQYDAVG